MGITGRLQAKGKKIIGKELLMETMFKGFTLGTLEMVNRFMFPPIKLAYGNPDGGVSGRQRLPHAPVSQRENK